MSHLPGSVRGQILPGEGGKEGGRSGACTPARRWSLSKASSRFAETPPCWGMHLPRREVRARSLSSVLAAPQQEGQAAGAPVSWQAVAGGREEIFPVVSLVSSLRWKESQEKPLLPAGSRERCRAVVCGQRLRQVSEPSSPGPMRVREGLYFTSSCWQVWGLLQTYFLRHPASCLHIVSSLHHRVSPWHLRLGSYFFLWDSQASLGRGASGQALWYQGDRCLLRIQRGRGTQNFIMEHAKAI